MELDTETLTMQETCELCEKKQETNDIFHRYEDLGFSLCDKCDSLGTVEVNRRYKLKNGCGLAFDEKPWGRANGKRGKLCVKGQLCQNCQTKHDAIVLEGDE